MKKVSSILLASVILLTTVSVFVVSGEDNIDSKITKTYYFEEPAITRLEIDEDSYSRIILKDTLSGDEIPGYPSLPNKEVHLLLPQGTDVDSIRVTGKCIFLGEDFIVEPTEEPVPFSELESASNPVPDEEIYRSEEMYPGRLYSEVSEYGYRGYKILVLLLHPVQYLPIKGELYYYPELTVNVYLTNNGIVDSSYRGVEEDESRLEEIVDNPEFVSTYDGGLASRSSGQSDSYDLLIITDDSLVYNFEPLKNRHNADGIETVIKTISEITNDPDFWYNGPWGDKCCEGIFNDTQCQIRNFIRMAYHLWGIEYVLLGGDNDLIPARNLYFGRWKGITYSGPSDVYYACLDGNFNYDKDSRWGERFDGRDINDPLFGDVDLYSEVYVGRACVDNPQEANNFVNKTLMYLDVDPADDYLDEVTLAGEKLLFLDWNGNGWGKKYLEQLCIPSDYSIYKLYDRDWQENGWPEPYLPGVGGWPKNLLIDNINSGVHILNHVGHCNYSSMMKLDISDITSLTNNKHCFVYSQGCYAGGFDKDNCVAEYMTVKTDKGAFAGVFNARLGFLLRFTVNGPAQMYLRRFWDAVFNEGLSVISKANQDAKEENIPFINLFKMRYTYYQLNLFGDPTLDLLVHTGGSGSGVQNDEESISTPTPVQQKISTPSND